MIEVKTKEELDKIREKHAFNVTAYTWDQCGICKKFLPEIERECGDLASMTPFTAIPTIHCPIEQPFCYDEMMNMGQNGVPFIVGKKRGKEEPSFEIKGKKTNKLKQAYGILKDIVIETKEKMVDE